MTRRSGSRRVKAGLRLALADPIELYRRCGDAIAGPARTHLSNLRRSTWDSPAYQRSATSSTTPVRSRPRNSAVGVTRRRSERHPPEEPCAIVVCAERFANGAVHVPAGGSDIVERVVVQHHAASETDKIWLPNLPVHGLNRRSPAGTQMPAGFPTCTVYFPGTYPDAVVLERADLLHIGHLLLRERGPGPRRCLGGRRRWRNSGLHDRPGGDLLRRERPGYAQHDRARGHMGARRRGACGRGERRRRLPPVQQAIRRGHRSRWCCQRPTSRS